MKKVQFSFDDIALPKLNSHIALTEAYLTRNEPKNVINKSYIKINKYPKIKIKNNKKEIYKTLDIIHKFNLENRVDEVYNEEILMQQKRDKINSNKEIKEKRLGIFKKKVPENEEEKTQENKIQIINEKLLEKYGMKEKERKIEKKYNFNLKEIDKMEKEIQESAIQIKEIVGKVENNKLEINVINDYGENIDKQQINSEAPIRLMEKKNHQEFTNI